jgi:hypothetical protein
MGRLLAIVLFVLGVYAAATVATEGVDGAFGGLFAGEEPIAAPSGPRDSQAAPGNAFAPQPVTRRVHDKVQGLVDDRAERAGES